MTKASLPTKVAYFCAGASFGAVVALVFAPKSGKETREYIVAKAGHGADFVADRSRELLRQAEDVKERGKTFVSRQRDRLAEALKPS